ncbi:type II secretion system protein [Microbacterium sp. cx-59]|uniref:type II secretion system protein n=1 Tax=Microbacterium sp. cx-59 TaxID=2891207 RepID=UPI001E5B55BB|nr:prepilin-type N-terminal cleavage/methylation domain-containing protein [Microbacterium sp. cx-59]MCC4907770.1 prepilin-type N-terminal cleavage/methylation domain-containing protein [Microbacterium sp. cx-59]
MAHQTSLIDTERNGFTIVELLIVVVIIAVLAAIVIANYSGIINRARSVSMHTAATQYRDALALYQAQYGRYPRSFADHAPMYGSGYYYACLGKGYTVHGGPKAACVWSAGHNAYVDAAFNDELAKVATYSPNMATYNPVCSTRSIDGQTQCSQGIVFQSVEPGVPAAPMLDGEPMINYIYYTLPFDNGCVETLKSTDGSQTYRRDATAKEDGTNYSDDLSSCVMALPSS